VLLAEDGERVCSPQLRGAGPVAVERGAARSGGASLGTRDTRKPPPRGVSRAVCRAGACRGLLTVLPAALWWQRPLQTSCDDRDIGSNTFPRNVRVYDPNGKLSRHMNPDIDELVHKFESSLGLPPLMCVYARACGRAWLIVRALSRACALPTPSVQAVRFTVPRSGC
jgi:hypothetical protein